MLIDLSRKTQTFAISISGEINCAGTISGFPVARIVSEEYVLEFRPRTAFYPDVGVRAKERLNSDFVILWIRALVSQNILSQHEPAEEVQYYP